MQNAEEYKKIYKEAQDTTHYKIANILQSFKGRR